MKKIQMLLLAVLIIGAASAFTTSTVNDLYIFNGSSYELKSQAGGRCTDNSMTHCTYEIIDEPVEPILTTPSNFEPRDVNKVWEP